MPGQSTTRILGGASATPRPGGRGPASRVLAIAAAFVVVLVVAWAVGAAAARTVHAQSSPVSASVDKSDLSMSETLTLTVTVTGQTSVSTPDLPDIDGLRLIGLGTNVAREQRDGAFLARFEFTYTFRPTRSGAIEIGPITVRAGSQTFATEPLGVNVAPAALGAPPPAATPVVPDLNSRLSSLFGQGNFSRAEVDHERPYLGQQITYTFKFYSTDGVYRPTYRAPDFAGFWNVGQQPETSDFVEVGGRQYLVTQTDTILFPNLAGEMTIEPGLVLQPTGVFRSRRGEFPSAPMTLNVRPLPANEPPGFAGAVGRYSITASVNADSVEVGEPVLLSAQVTGEGNVNTLPDPLWPDVPGTRAYDGDTSVQSGVKDGVFVGVKTFERALVPDVAGKIEVPPVEYVYFDPDIERYVTVASAPILLDVAPGASGETDTAGADAADGESSLVLDIRHVKPSPGRLGTPLAPVTSFPLYWVGWAAPALVALGVAAWIVVARRRRAVVEAGRADAARTLALTRLSELRAEASQSDAASAALRGYLTTVLGTRAETLTADRISAMVQERGAAPETAIRLEATLASLDRARFAPRVGERSDGDAADVAQEVADIVERLGKELAP